MNKKIVLANGVTYNLEDFYISNLLKNDSLLNELDMKTLPDIFMKVFGVKCLDACKPVLLKKIDLYDQSPAVNSFIYKGNSYWLDKQQRSCMKTVAESGLDNIEIVFGNQSTVFPAEFVKQFILNLEAYAYKCYVITAKHKQRASSLKNYEDIINYDYTVGYPEKIVLE